MQVLQKGKPMTKNPKRKSKKRMSVLLKNGFSLTFWRDREDTLNLTLDCYNNAPDFFKTTSGRGMDSGILGAGLAEDEHLTIAEKDYLCEMFLAFIKNHAARSK